MITDPNSIPVNPNSIPVSRHRNNPGLASGRFACLQEEELGGSSTSGEGPPSEALVSRGRDRGSGRGRGLDSGRGFSRGRGFGKGRGSSRRGRGSGRGRENGKDMRSDVINDPSLNRRLGRGRGSAEANDQSSRLYHDLGIPSRRDIGVIPHLQRNNNLNR